MLGFSPQRKKSHAETHNPRPPPSRPIVIALSNKTPGAELQNYFGFEKDATTQYVVALVELATQVRNKYDTDDKDRKDDHDDHDKDDQVAPWTIHDIVDAWLGEGDARVYHGHWERRPSIAEITTMIMDGSPCPEQSYHAINYDEERSLCEEMGAASFCVDDMAAMVRDAAHTIIDDKEVRTKEVRTKMVREELVGTATRLLAQRASLPNPYAVEYAVRVSALALSQLFGVDFRVADLYEVMTTDKAVANFHQSVDELKEDDEFVDILGTKYELEKLNELALEHLGRYDNRRGEFVLDEHAKSVVAKRLSTLQ